MPPSPKVDNAAEALRVKVELRRWALAQVEAPSVLETRAGTGVMRAEVYGGLPWFGFDVRPDLAPGAARVAAEVGLRALDLAAFNVFDVDAWGLPWHDVWLIAQRRRLAPGERIALIVTDGSMGGLASKQPSFVRAGWSTQMLSATGMPPHQPCKGAFTGDRPRQLAETLLLTWFAPHRVVAMRGATGKTHQRVRYYAATLTGAA